MDRAGGEYTYTTEFLGATRLDESHIDVLQHLEGDFPGGGSRTLVIRVDDAGNATAGLS